jgi:proteasome lid subunit RPN8/RPN11
VQLPADIRTAVLAHARFCLPQEACGLLAVDLAGRVRFAYCLTNAAASSRRFRIDPVEHFGALRHAEGRGWAIEGLFHSHPSTPPYPSPHDVAGSPGASWLHLLVGPMASAEPDLRAFRIDGASVREVAVAAG